MGVALRMQYLWGFLLRIQNSLKFPFFKVWNWSGYSFACIPHSYISAFLIAAFLVHSTSLYPNPLKIYKKADFVSWRVNRIVEIEKKRKKARKKVGVTNISRHSLGKKKKMKKETRIIY